MHLHVCVENEAERDLEVDLELRSPSIIILDSIIIIMSYQ
jgi:hypothetical protein